MQNNSWEALNAIFNPRSIAVIGASDTFGKWGHWMMDRPMKTGYQGVIYPINPTKKDILGLKAYPNVAAVPGDIDLAVITTPTATVPGVLKECIAKGIKGAVVISAGFAETGKKGRELEQEMMAVARSGDIRLVGPNCMGIFSASGRLSLCFPVEPKAGSISFVSQSGTFGVSIAVVAAAQGYGLSKFVSIGNQADLGMADYVEYLADDADTNVIALYVEGFKDGERFFEVAREVGQVVPAARAQVEDPVTPRPQPVSQEASPVARLLGVFLRRADQRPQVGQVGVHAKSRHGSPLSARHLTASGLPRA